MERPYTICHILSALDGKITGAFMGTEAAGTVSGEYARIRSEYQADAWLYGTVTTKEFTGNRKPEPDPGKRFLTVILWQKIMLHSTMFQWIHRERSVGNRGPFVNRGRPDAHVIEVLTEQTPAAYRAYLRRHGVSYILAGSKMLDGRLALEKVISVIRDRHAADLRRRHD